MRAKIALLLLLMAFFVWSEDLKVITSKTQYFTYTVPSSWRYTAKETPIAMEVANFTNDLGAYFMTSSVDMYDRLKTSPGYSTYTRSNFSYRNYSPDSINAALKGYIESYIGGLTYPNLLVQEKKVSKINGEPCLYVRFSFSAGDETVVQETFDILYMGVDTKLSYGVMQSKKSMYYPTILNMINSVKYK